MGGAEADDEFVKEENLISISKVAAAANGGDGVVDIIVQSPPANQTFSSSSSIGPVTPDSDREIGGEQHHHEFSSPLTDTTETNNDNDSSSQTPKDTLFDSFAPPGTDDKLLFAPHHNKYKFIRDEGSRANVVRGLNFTGVTITRHEDSTISNVEKEEEEEEEILFQIVYDAIVEAIVSEQQQQTKQQQQELGDEFPRTPPKSYRHGIIETPCPGAPIKSTTKYSRINLLDKEICKRLEF